MLITACGPKEFFDDMPTKFKVDSLSALTDLFAGLTVKHLDDNVIEIKSSDPDMLPFAGVLEVRNDTIYYRQAEGKQAMPYLNLNAPKFDTLRIDYSLRRADQVVSMGTIYDAGSKDSLYYFSLKPLKRVSSYQTIYLKIIALRRGEGIKYLTFGKDDHSVTIAVMEFPMVIAKPPYPDL